MIGKKGKLKDIGHGSHVMPTCFLDLDSRAPQTKSFNLTRSFRIGSGFSSVECFHRRNVSIASIMLFCFISPEYSLIICDPNPATSARGVTFLAVEQAVDKLLAWVVKGTSACHVPVVFFGIIQNFRAVKPEGLKLFNFIDDRLRQTCGVQVAFCSWGTHIISNERAFLSWFMLHSFSWTGCF